MTKRYISFAPMNRSGKLKYFQFIPEEEFNRVFNTTDEYRGYKNKSANLYHLVVDLKTEKYGPGRYVGDSEILTHEGVVKLRKKYKMKKYINKL